MAIVKERLRPTKASGNRMNLRGSFGIIQRLANIHRLAISILNTDTSRYQRQSGSFKGAFNLR